MLRNLLIVALGGVLLGCQQEPTIPKLGEQAIALTLELSTRTLGPGKADTIRVTAQSNIADPVELDFSSNCTIVVTIHDASNNLVVPPNGKAGCLPVPATLAWDANGAITRLFIWNGGTDFDPPGSTTRVPDGSYFISASMSGLGYSTFAPAFRIDVVP